MRLAQQLYEGVDVKRQAVRSVLSLTFVQIPPVFPRKQMQQQEIIFPEQYGKDYVSKIEKAVKNGQENPGCTRGNPSH